MLTLGVILMTKKVLDHGYVKMIASLGDDDFIAQAARVSYQQGTTTTRANVELIDYLMRHQHTSPFEMVEFVFEIKAPIFIARQWFRHRTASVNEMSGRYSIMPSDFYVPTKLRAQDPNNKQGSIEASNNNDYVIEQMHKTMQNAFEIYNYSLTTGVAREQARIMLPLSTYTKFVWKQDLKNLLHFIKLRRDPHAQQEIRVYAEAIEGFIKEVVPATYNSWLNHQAESITFSRDEWKAIVSLASEELKSIKEKVSSSSLGKKSLDREFMEKLNRGQ